MKKPLLISLAILSVVGVAAASLAVFLPVSYNYDKNLIKENKEYSITLVDGGKYKTLEKTGDGDFKIIGFTDTHLDTYRKKCTVTLEMVIRNIVREKPDLVVFDGDVITSSFNRRRAKQFVDVMDKLGVYWTAVLGNHEGDNVWSVSRPELLNIYAKSPYCLIETGQKTTNNGKTVDGFGNHVINLKIGDSIAQSLFFIDGGAYMSQEDLNRYKEEIEDPQCNNYDYIKESQIDWYEEVINDISSSYNKTVKSMMFTHIPLKEYKEAYELLTGENEVTGNTPDYSKVKDGNQILFGVRRETICYSGHNSGLFQKILEIGSTQAVVAGHDHINDFVLNYKGVRLGYCQSSGYSSYNVATRGTGEQLLQGYSEFLISENGDLSWNNKKNADVWPELENKVSNLFK